MTSQATERWPRHFSSLGAVKRLASRRRCLFEGHRSARMRRCRAKPGVLAGDPWGSTQWWHTQPKPGWCKGLKSKWEGSHLLCRWHDRKARNLETYLQRCVTSLLPGRRGFALRLQRRRQRRSPGSATMRRITPRTSEGDAQLRKLPKPPAMERPDPAPRVSPG